MASHAYSKSEGGSDREVVELYDAGCGSIVGDVLPLTGLVVVALHGDDGRGLVQASRAELASTLARIHALMMWR